MTARRRICAMKFWISVLRIGGNVRIIRKFVLDMAVSPAYNNEVRFEGVSVYDAESDGCASGR